MRYDYSHRVWETSLKGGKLLLMLALAHHADPTGACWPGMETLAAKARLTDRQVRRLLNELEEDAYIKIEERAIGRGKSPLYQLFPEAKAEEMSAFSDEKAEEMSAFNQDKPEEMSALNEEKADISEQNQSHARSGTPIGGWVGSSSNSNKKKPTYPPKPSHNKTLEPMQQIAFELLVDSEIGVIHRVANELARKLPAQDIFRMVDKWLPDHHAGKVETGALVSRLKEVVPRAAHAVTLSAGFRNSELFHRHRLPDELIADGRKKYSEVPAEPPRKVYSQ